MDFYRETPPRELSMYGIEFFHQESRATSRVNSHMHSAIEILYITEGDFRIEIDRASFSAHAGDMVLIRSSSVHSLYQISPGRGGYYVCKCSLPFLNHLFKGMDNTEYILFFLRSRKGDTSVFCAECIPPTIHAVLESMIAEYKENSETMLTMEKAYTGVLIVAISRAFFCCGQDGENAPIASDRIALIQESIEYIRQKYATALTVTECAKRVNLSYSYYARLFRTITGKSFKRYLSDVRVSSAYNMLLSTELPVTEVALCCGYNSSAYFASEFRKAYGCTPSETRNAARQKHITSPSAV